MGWRFRKSFSPLPGVRITFSPSGISTSIGVGPLRVTHGNSGNHVTARVPGSGLSFTHKINGGVNKEESVNERPENKVYINPYELSEVRSDATAVLTTPGLIEFKNLISKARRESAEIDAELALASENELISAKKFNSWKNGNIFKHIFKSKFQEIESNAKTSTEKREELEYQKSLTKIKTEIKLPDIALRAFYILCDRFAELSEAEFIWDTTGKRSANRVVERTSATEVIRREKVKFKLGKCELIDVDFEVPHLENANGGDIYIYPGFLVYFISEQAFALLEVSEFSLSGKYMNFIEEEVSPRDSELYGETWRKVNKDGSPDRRFNNNYKVPVYRYGVFSFGSLTGMNEEYMVSDGNAAIEFLAAFDSFKAIIQNA